LLQLVLLAVAVVIGLVVGEVLRIVAGR